MKWGPGPVIKVPRETRLNPSVPLVAFRSNGVKKAKGLIAGLGSSDHVEPGGLPVRIEGRHRDHPQQRIPYQRQCPQHTRAEYGANQK
jgi:hypothetical protein